jgi:hypothetical protein
MKVRDDLVELFLCIHNPWSKLLGDTVENFKLLRILRRNADERPIGCEELVD